MNPSRIAAADTHCHLTARVFQKDRKRVIERALENGVQWIVVPGMDLESSYVAVELANEYSGVHAGVGIHPHNADQWTESYFKELKDLALSDKVVAIGEIGLDYYRNLSSPENQRHAFQAQLRLGAELNLPVIVHNREATVAVMELLQDWVMGIDPPLQGRAGVLHAFSADLDTGLALVEAGFYLGIAGPISYKNSSKLQQVASSIPISRMVTETDSPYLTPHPNRNRRNEPANVIVVAEHLSRIVKRDYDSTVKITSQNAAKLFGWQNGKN
jgi:TatD DNase family protein